MSVIQNSIDKLASILHNSNINRYQGQSNKKLIQSNKLYDKKLNTKNIIANKQNIGKIQVRKSYQNNQIDSITAKTQQKCQSKSQQQEQDCECQYEYQGKQLNFYPSSQFVPVDNNQISSQQFSSFNQDVNNTTNKQNPKKNRSQTVNQYSKQIHTNIPTKSQSLTYNNFIQRKSSQLKSQYPTKTVIVQTNNQVPNSYILAMQKLQNSIINLQKQLKCAHQQLLKQEKQKLQTEQRMNKILKNQKLISEENQRYLVENRSLKFEVQELRKRWICDHQNQDNHNNQFNQPQSSKQFKQIKKSQTQNNDIKEIQHSESRCLPSPTFNSESSKIQNHAASMQPSSRIKDYSEPNYQSAAYIDYYRKIMRSQKQLVALEYRQECLERKLGGESDKQKCSQFRRKLKKVTLQISELSSRIKEMKENELGY